MCPFDETKHRCDGWGSFKRSQPGSVGNVEQLLVAPTRSSTSDFHHPRVSVKINVSEVDLVRTDWRASTSLLMLRFVRSIAQPLKHCGRWLEKSLNRISANGGLLETAHRLATNSKELVIPAEDSDSFLSINAHIDPRAHLFQEEEALGTMSDARPDCKAIADVCAMASKLAYENSGVIKNVVEETWKMHFVGSYDCWNEFQKKNSTQAFIFMDREHDARTLVLAFRGTEPFNGYDWCTDFDFSWYALPNVGCVHLGFLEALGLGDRNDMRTFQRMKRNIYENSRTPRSPASGLSNRVLDDEEKPLAYDHLSDKLISLLNCNKQAKLYVTGHSLGGALATLFTAMLFYKSDVSADTEDEMTSRLAAVYTFGQPRVGDENFASFMDRNLNQPINRYFRIVYNSDVVARLPFDNSLFGFKHFGHCFYFNHHFKLQILGDEPNPNYFSPLENIFCRIVALLELIQSFFFSYIYGEDFQETTLSTMTRVAGVFFPGMAGHSMVNYINCIRLGPEHLYPSCSITLKGQMT